MLEKMDDLTSCSLSYVASILGGKWKPFIVWYLSMAPGKSALQRIEKAHPLRYLPQNVQSAFKRAGASGDHRAYRRGGQAASGRLSSHGEGRKLRERLVFHPGLGAAYGGFSAETLQRTKGTMGDGVLMYGSAASDAEQGSGERIIGNSPLYVRRAR